MFVSEQGSDILLSEINSITHCYEFSKTRQGIYNLNRRRVWRGGKKLQYIQLSDGDLTKRATFTAYRWLHTIIYFVKATNQNFIINLLRENRENPGSFKLKQAP